MSAEEFFWTPALTLPDDSPYDDAYFAPAGLAFGGSVSAAVGSFNGPDGKGLFIATSDEPERSWAFTSISDDLAVSQTYYVSDVVSNGEKWLIIGTEETQTYFSGTSYAPTYWTATDPTGTWVKHQEAKYLRRAAQHGGLWISDDQFGRLWTASDPAGTWTQGDNLVDLLEDAGYPGPYFGYLVTALGFVNGTWLMFSWDYNYSIYRGRLWSSEDPTSGWTLRSTFDQDGYFWQNTAHSLLYTHEGWVIASNTVSLLADSLDGPWTLVTTNRVANQRVVYAGGEYRGLESDSIWSTDSIAGAFEVEEVDVTDDFLPRMIAVSGSKWMASSEKYLVIPSDGARAGWGITL